MALKGNMTVRTMAELAFAAGLELHFQMVKPGHPMVDWSLSAFYDCTYSLAA